MKIVHVWKKMVAVYIGRKEAGGNLGIPSLGMV
jgi:hypothetical protein